MLNPSKNAATSAGHMESGTKVLARLPRRPAQSDRPQRRTRRSAPAPPASAPTSRRTTSSSASPTPGRPLMWVSFDSLGTGLGAQSNIDGRECGCYEDMTGSRMLDIELEESAPTLHYFRRLCPNSGGHGYRRGGMGIDTAWRTLGMSRTQMTVFSNVTRVPSRAPGGGYPGGGTGNLIFKERDRARLADRPRRPLHRRGPDRGVDPAAVARDEPADRRRGHHPHLRGGRLGTRRSALPRAVAGRRGPREPDDHRRRRRVGLRRRHRRRRGRRGGDARSAGARSAPSGSASEPSHEPAPMEQYRPPLSVERRQLPLQPLRAGARARSARTGRTTSRVRRWPLHRARRASRRQGPRDRRARARDLRVHLPVVRQHARSRQLRGRRGAATRTSASATPATRRAKRSDGREGPRHLRRLRARPPRGGRRPGGGRPRARGLAAQQRPHPRASSRRCSATRSRRSPTPTPSTPTSSPAPSGCGSSPAPGSGSTASTSRQRPAKGWW